LNESKLEGRIALPIFLIGRIIYMNNKIKYSFLFLGLLSLFFSSCSKKVSMQTAKQDLIIYPSPPDTARIQFLISVSSSENTAKKRSGFSKFLLGEPLAKPIQKPYGVAIHGGKIYICDTGLGCIDIIDLEKGTFNYFMPKGQGQLQSPLNCFVDDDEKLYVADVVRRQIVIFDNAGTYLGCLGEKDNFKPTDVFVSDNKIWVVNLKNNCINVYSKDDFGLLSAFPDSAAGKEEHLYSPTNLFIRNDTVYVSDMGDFKIKLYSTAGKYLKSVGNLGVKAGQMVRPKGIAVDRESNLYVVDASTENTQIFNKEGKLLMFFGGTYQGPGGMWLPAKIAVDYDNMKYFEKYVDPAFDLKYLVLVTNQFGPDKLNIYGRVDPKPKSRK
jgi:DNA-binding beta-propeller fold protein YncE